MLTQDEADRLVAILKHALRTDAFTWELNHRQDEILVEQPECKLKFVLSLKRNPFEIRLHLRTRDRDIGLARLDNHGYHINPDGQEIGQRSHLHLYRESYDLAWAEPVEWCEVEKPLDTLEQFLRVINSRFPAGLQVPLI